MGTAYAAIGTGCGRVVTADPRRASDRDRRGARGDQADRRAHGRRPEDAGDDPHRPGACGDGGGRNSTHLRQLPGPVAGKTGTTGEGLRRERLAVPDQAWYAALAPADRPRDRGAVTIERGGGLQRRPAAPVAARILEKVFSAPETTPVVSAKRHRPDERRQRTGTEEARTAAMTMDVRAGGIAERMRLPYMDGWTLLAAIGLIVSSCVVLAEATADDVAAVLRPPPDLDRAPSESP